MSDERGVEGDGQVKGEGEAVKVNEADLPPSVMAMLTRTPEGMVKKKVFHKFANAHSLTHTHIYTYSRTDTPTHERTLTRKHTCSLSDVIRRACESFGGAFAKGIYPNRTFEGSLDGKAKRRNGEREGKREGEGEGEGERNGERK